MVTCSRCGRSLTDPRSIDRRMGPVCATKEGILELRQEAQLLSSAEPIDLQTEAQMLQMLQKGNIPLSSCLMSTFGQAEKRIKRQGYRFYHEYSIHAPSRLERDIQNNQLAYNFKALIYDVVTKTEEGA
ncbi:MAG: DUF6011 domain-containing protein [Candidatus Hodarchaeota archaeon]